ncbi:MAG: hypothetical protein A2Z20_06090 [Bdellovibrionales bacterium RBG_16_40_8]|nr:MAG: hypothetical protein A2Z20_06090 [Bdellovibrionales bacterium RBG_16_40_8]
MQVKVNKMTVFATLLLLLLSFSLSACGPTFLSTKSTREQKTFVDIVGANTNSPTKYVINFNRNDLNQVLRPSDAPEEIKFDTELARKIKSVKVNKKEDLETGSYEVQFKISKNNIIKTVFFDINDEAWPNKSILATDKNSEFGLRMICSNEECESAWLLLGETSSNQFAEIKYERKIEYFTDKKNIQNNKTSVDQKLLTEAIKFGLPVERHSANITFGSNIDVLVVKLPPTDSVDEDFFDTDKENIKTPEITKDLPIESSVELETIIEKPKAMGGAKKGEPNELTLTEDLNAVYRVSLPKLFFKAKSNFISDPLELKTSFSIKPIESQQEFEPAYRISLIAQAFVNQNVKIYKNACNIFVRAVMNLSGYTAGSHYSANEFNKLFNNKAQGLNLWRRENYKNLTGQTQTLELSRLTNYLKKMPQAHAVIVQVDRSLSGKHGHVGILTREGSDIVIYDSSLNTHGPRRSVIKVDSIVNKSRPKVTIYSMPEMIVIPRESVDEA